MEKVLIVDDELNMRVVLQAMLKKKGYQVAQAADGLEALECLEKEQIDVVVTDLKMPKLSGLGLLEHVTSTYPETPVIIITAHGTIETAVDALKKGAFDYITKPFDRDELISVIEKAIRTRIKNHGEVILAEEEIDKYGIVGCSEKIREIYKTIEKVASTKTTILITGETGTGKELIAHAIHRGSPRKDNAYIKINCGAIAKNLIEAELFGYEKGAFTGAASAKPGKFELADQGTIFLDEIGEIPRDMQVKLLQVLQDQTFERVGGIKTIQVDVRIIAATNRDLIKEIKEGNFREDLYYRLNVVPIKMPPLRERKEDIIPLTHYFLDRFNDKLNMDIKGIDPQVLECFKKYNWPGNIRELENLIERIILLTKGNTISPEDVPEEIKTKEDQDLPENEVHEKNPFEEYLLREMENFTERLVLMARSEKKREAGDRLEEDSLDSTEKDQGVYRKFIKSKTAEVEKKMIEKILEECSGNITHAAKRLGFSRKGLQIKMVKYNLRKK
ncbi:MAG: Transcriptional regulatory protein ZraR [Syntrophus sp. PtaB.Bin075]|nr:MAG: Transcriptional regulatory protein ZraR [Syntrophus sp. PtaB.Bin075]